MTSQADDHYRASTARSFLRTLRRSGDLPIYLPMMTVVPTLAVFNHNASFVETSELLLPLCLSLGFALALFFLLLAALRQTDRAALNAAIFMLWFMTYGHWQELLGSFEISISPDILITKNKLVYLIGAIVCAITFFASKRWIGKLGRLSKALNLIACVLIIFNLVVITSRKVPAWVPELSSQASPPPSATSRPCGDIYYIILDAYGRHDTLKEIYQFDNGDFLDYLEAKGFYLAERSHANYAQTLLSLASSLNMEYLNSAISNHDELHDYRSLLSEMIRSSVVFQRFREEGYQIVTFDAVPWNLASVRSHDVHIEPSVWQPTTFQHLVFQLTPLPLLFKRLSTILPNWPKPMDLATRHRLNVRHAFTKLADVPNLPGKKFVFFHVLSPHQPFVFDAQGNDTDPGIFDRMWNPIDNEDERIAYIAGYSQQIEFVTKIMISTIRLILESTEPRPVVILQGDHGPASRLDPESLKNTDTRERMSILNALLIPDLETSDFREDLSPVNTFRLVFNKCFHANYDLLPDESFFSTWSRPGDFERVY